MKTLKNIKRHEKVRFAIPRSVQDIIPVKTVWQDGIFYADGKYSKTFKFEDINYSVAGKEDQEAMFLEYCELLNSLDSTAVTKITLNNRRLNKKDLEKNILIACRGDGLDKYRKEYNQMLLDKASGANAVVQDKYITVSASKKSIEESRNYFARIGAELSGHFSRLGSRCTELDINLSLIHI